MTPRRARTAFLVAVVLVTVLLLLPSDRVPSGNDKLGHLVVFAVLGALGLFAGWRPLRLLGGLAAYAALTELLQASLPIGRHGDPLDWVVDVLGVALGLALGVRTRGGSDPWG